MKQENKVKIGMRKKMLSLLFGFGGFSLLLAGGSLVRAKAAFVPADNQVIETLKGKWKYEAPGTEPPFLNFTAPEADITFSFVEKPMEWENINKVIYMPRVQASLVLSRSYLDCLGSPLKLWFESGESLELGKNSCSEARLYATSRTGDRVEDRMRENHLAQMLNAHHVVAISQNKKAIIIAAPDEEEIRKYQMQTSLAKNSPFVKMMKRSWDEALKRGY